MSKIIITRVGDPENPQQKPNGSMDAGTVKIEGREPFSWFQLEVAVKRGLRKTIATRNFIADQKDGLDREAAVEAMNEQIDVGEGDDGLRVETVNIVPRRVVIDGEPQVDSSGNPVFQTTANIIVLPGETLRAALHGTDRTLTLAEDAPMSSVATDSDLSDAAVNADDLAAANV